jgi:Domain of unknown function (DUF6265)
MRIGRFLANWEFLAGLEVSGKGMLIRSAISLSAACLLLLTGAPIQSPVQALPQQATGAGTAQSANPEPPSADNLLPNSAANPAGNSQKPPAKITLANFDWLAGHWQGSWGPRVAQVSWMPPKSAVMLGMLQITEDDKTLVTELYSIVQTPAGIELHVRHFTPSLVTWEKSDAIVLKLVAATDSKNIVFENPANGQPKSAAIRRIDGETYASQSEIAPGKGNLQVVEIIFHRQREAPASRRH